MKRICCGGEIQYGKKLKIRDRSDNPKKKKTTEAQRALLISTINSVTLCLGGKKRLLRVGPKFSISKTVILSIPAAIGWIKIADTFNQAIKHGLL